MSKKAPRVRINKQYTAEVDARNKVVRFGPVSVPLYTLVRITNMAIDLHSAQLENHRKRVIEATEKKEVEKILHNDLPSFSLPIVLGIPRRP